MLQRRNSSVRVAAVKWLTQREQMVVAVVLFLLLTGLAVKAWRTAHLPKLVKTHALP